jgi:hypothetical protein
MWSFPSLATFTSFPTLGCWMCAAAPAFTSLFIYSFLRDFLSPPLWHSGHPAHFDTCLFCYCLLFSFTFFPGWRSVCSGGYADLSQDCLMEYRMPLAHLVACIFPSSLDASVWWPRGPPGFSI